MSNQDRCVNQGRGGVRFAVNLVCAGLLACTSGTEPSQATAPVRLYPATLGTQWTYAFRDTVIRGGQKAPIVLPYSVTHSRDTVALGVTWMVLENGSIVFNNVSGSRALVRNGTLGLQRLLADSVFIVPFTFTVLPNTLGSQGIEWRLTGVKDTVNTPAGQFVAWHYTQPFASNLQNHLWLAPGIGVVRTLTGLVTSGPVDSLRFVLELTRQQ